MAKTVLKRDDAAKAVALQDRLTNDYLPYFTTLSKSTTVFNKENRGVITTTLGKIKRAIALIARVYLGVGTTVSTPRELATLNQFLEEISQARDYIIIRARDIEYKGLKEALKQAKELTAISSEELSLAVNLSRADKKKFGQRTKKSGGSAKGAGGIGGIAGSVLGGLGLKTPGQIAGAGIASQLAAAIMGPYATPGILLGGYQALRLGGYVGKKGMQGIGLLGKTLMRSGKLPGQSWEDFGGSSGTGLPSGGLFSSFTKKKGRAELENASDPLFHFFDKRASKAKWTRDFLRAIKRLGGRGKTGEEGAGLDIGKIIGGTALGSTVGAAVVSFLGSAAIPALTVTAITVTGAFIISKLLRDIEKDVGKIDRESLRLSDVLLDNIKKQRLTPKQRYNKIKEVLETKQKVLGRQYQLSKLPGGKSWDEAKAELHANEAAIKANEYYAKVYRVFEYPGLIPPKEADEMFLKQPGLKQLGPPVFKHDAPEEDPLKGMSVEEILMRMYDPSRPGGPFDGLLKESKKTNELLEKQTRPSVVEEKSSIDDDNISNELKDALGNPYKN